jgi:serine/threonine-protein kinase
MYPQVFGKYVLERELARGGMARVMLATLRGAGGFEKKLVVKQIRDDLASDDEFVRRFVEEAKTTVALAHPNIVPVYELGVELGTYFLAMEYVAGASLAELLRAGAGRGLSPEEGAYIGVEVCRALDYAHRRMNVVHGDVTPRNVMVDEEGQVKVIDFGICAPVATAPSGQGVFGSPGHMPPEQLAGKQLTPAADVFAVSVLLMELWCGRAPFRRRTREEVEAAMMGPHPKPSDADIRLATLDEVLAHAMSLDPDARPQQADELSRALRKFLSGLDLGDVARKLGDRVCHVREHPLAPASEQSPVLQRPPSRPTAMQVQTKTFALREEVLSGAAPSTRKLPSSIPAPAMLPESFGRFASGGLVLVGIGGVVAISLLAFLIGRGAASTPGSTSTSTAAGAMPVAVAVVASPSSDRSPARPSARAADGPSPAAPVDASGIASDARGHAAEAARTAQPAVDPANRAQLVLLGDGTNVTVDGAARGRTPVRVGVDPGTHAVLFAFPATGESKAVSLVLRAGEQATLRADFTGALPTIRVQR